MSVRKIPVLSTGLTAGAYATGQVMGNRFSFPAAVDNNEGAAFIRGCNVIDDSGTLVTAFELWLFAGNVTFGADKAAPSLTDAELKANILAILAFATTDIFATPQGCIAMYSGKDRLIKPNPVGATADGLTITGHLLARGAPAGFSAANNIQIDLYLQTISYKET